MLLNRLPGSNTRSGKGVSAALALGMALTLSGCFTDKAERDFARADGSVPWWCKGKGGAPDLNRERCIALSLKMDIALIKALDFPTVQDALDAGAVALNDAPAGMGYAFTFPGAPLVFDGDFPNVLLYNGADAGSRLAGIAWGAFSGGPPAGFWGNRDVWTLEGGRGYWWLAAWVIQGYHNHADVFAPTQPCLLADVIPASTTEACYTQAHTEPFEFVVTNDDGYSAEGIYELVDGLNQLPNVVVHVVAPAANQSGSGARTTNTDLGYEVSATTETMTGSHAGDTPYSATAVWSTDPANGADPIIAPDLRSGSPADSVNWAIDSMLLSPDLVISGINEGHNIANLVNLSGTVGAARTARNLGFPSIATSQASRHPNDAVDPDFPTGVTHTLQLVEEWRLGLRQTRGENVPNINIPTCNGGSVRGVVDVAVATSITGAQYWASDCASNPPALGENDVTTDVAAHNNGFVSITDVTSTIP